MKSLSSTFIAIISLQLVISWESLTLSEQNTNEQVQTKDGCTKFKCEKKHAKGKVGYLSGFEIKGEFLKDPKQRPVINKSEKECVRECVKQKKCKTISIVEKNVKNLTCYLSNNNIYEGKVIVHKNSKIISLGTPECLKAPCQNGGTCKPNYNKGGYTCACQTRWTGTHCTNIKNPQPLPNVTFTFDKDVNPIFNNDKRGKKYGIIVPKGIRVVSVPDAKTPVLMMKAGEENGITYTIQDMHFFTNPIVAPRNLTVGAWFKADFSQEKTESVDLFTIDTYYMISLTYSELTLLFNTDRGYKSATCEGITLHKTWNHVIVLFDDELFTLVLNGVSCKLRKATDFSHAGGYGNKLILLPTNEHYTRFIDLIKIYDYKVSSAFCKEWYKKDKKNYVIR